MENLGNKIRTYKPDSLNSTLLTCLAVLLVIIGMASIIFASAIGDGVMKGIIGGIGGGIILFYLAHKLKPKFSFDLHDRGVVAHNRQQVHTFLFSEIEDTACFHFGKGFGALHFGFRKTERDPWYMISPQIIRSADLITQFRNRYLSYRLPVVEKAINSGGQVLFRTVTNKSAFMARLTGTTAEAMFHEYTGKVIVNKHRLEIDHRVIDRNAIQSASLTSGGDILLYNNRNEQLLTIPAYITSGDVFVKILNRS